MSECGIDSRLLRHLRQFQRIVAIAYAAALPLSITASWVLLAAGVCSLVADLIARRTLRPLIDLPFVRPLLVFVGAIAVSGLINGGIREALLSVVKLYGLLVYFWAGSLFARDRDVAQGSLATLLCVSAVAGVLGAIEQRFNIHLTKFHYLQGTGFLSDPMAFCGQMQMFSMLALAAILTNHVLQTRAAPGTISAPDVESKFGTGVATVGIVVPRINYAARILEASRNWLNADAGIVRSISISSQNNGTNSSHSSSIGSNGGSNSRQDSSKQDSSELPATQLPWYCRRSTWAVVALCNLLGLIFAGERSAWLGGMAGVIALASLVSMRTVGRCTVAIALVGTISFFTVPLVHTRVQPLLVKQQDVSTAARFKIWAVAVQKWKTHPVFGIGFLKFPHLDIPEAIVPGKSKDLNHAHSNYLQMLSTTGLVGLVAYLCLCWAQLAAAFRLQRVGKVTGDYLLIVAGRGLFAASVALMVSGIFEYNFGTAQVRLAQWFLLALLAMGPVVPACSLPADVVRLEDPAENAIL